jgi:hypothetical protein
MPALEIVLRKIVSGGQTGVDRGALNAAIECGLPHGGWCPQGRLAEDGRIAARYDLRETESRQYHVRTEKNVQDSDGTLIVHRGPLSGGTELTRRFTVKHARPVFPIDLNEPFLPHSFFTWLKNQRIEVLNVAGPRESSCPGIGEDARQLLVGLLRELTTRPTQH